MTIDGIIKEQSRSCKESLRLYLNGIEERSTKPKVESSSLSGRT